MSDEHTGQPGSPITDDEVKARIEEFFTRNYDVLRQEGGHVLAEGAKRQALEQALHYWRKLKTIAMSVTETEVRLSLPGQVTPKGRPFAIEGVVDIVRDKNGVWMYDLKTHEGSEVRAERELYEDQLNVYAHIWKGVRRQSLDGTAIVATRLPADLRDALQSGDSASIQKAMESWQPVVELPFHQEDVQRTIEDFARCVDEIEDGNFAAATPDTLRQVRRTRRRKQSATTEGQAAESSVMFAQIHCVNCDARFSCRSYREYQRSEAGRVGGRRRAATLTEAAEVELDAWVEQNLAE